MVWWHRLAGRSQLREAIPGALRSIRDTRPCANGYRFAKWQGKPISTIRLLSLQNKHFCDFAVG
jgi:hypothetical protein